VIIIGGSEFLSKMCTAMKIQVNFFEIFETGPAQICADLLEIRIDKKKSNQKYCQSSHLIRGNGLSLRK
jgi:hypothetical protein